MYVCVWQRYLRVLRTDNRSRNSILYVNSNALITSLRMLRTDKISESIGTGFEFNQDHLQIHPLILSISVIRNCPKLIYKSTMQNGRATRALCTAFLSRLTDTDMHMTIHILMFDVCFCVPRCSSLMSIEQVVDEHEEEQIFIHTYSSRPSSLTALSIFHVSSILCVRFFFHYSIVFRSIRTTEYELILFSTGQP